MATSLAAAAFLLRRSQSDLRLSARERLAIGAGAFCGAMIGSKLPFLFADWEELRTGWAWFSSGKTILLGFAGGYAGVELAKWTLEIKTRTGDSFAAPVAVAVAIGRLACFAGGCCYGQPTTLPWGVIFPNVDSLPRHPTQIYEAAFHLCCAAILWLARRAGWCRENLFKLYIATYACYRFASEFIRPEAELWGGLTGYQWASLALAIAFLGLAACHRPSAERASVGP